MSTYIVPFPERIDEIVMRHYGTLEGGILELVLKANPHLDTQTGQLAAGQLVAGQLAAGTMLTLPPLSLPTAPEEEALW